MTLAPLAVVIPALDEAANLPLLLADLQAGQGLIHELVVVDGGSADGTARVAQLAGARLVSGPRGRGAQLLAGIEATTAPWLWLLHADLRLPAAWPSRLSAVLHSGNDTAHQRRAWYADLKLPLRGPHYRLLEALVALRSRLLQRPYGDQGLLISRGVYDQVGGLRPLPLMEDLEFAERFARSGRLSALGLAITVDGRRWRRHGLVATSWRNARLRRAWRGGATAQELCASYYASPAQGAYQNAQRRSSGSRSQP